MYTVMTPVKQVIHTCLVWCVTVTAINNEPMQQFLSNNPFARLNCCTEAATCTCVYVQLLYVIVVRPVV